MLYTGVDLVEIDRLAHMHTIFPSVFERFVRRVYTPDEILEAKGKYPYYAGRFAAKEAAAKALHCGIGGIGWQSLEILQGKQGEPILRIHDKAAVLVQEQNITEWSVSISHTDTLAVAMVVMQ
jgi:holo-[acyl-carrier protein] synthase